MAQHRLYAIFFTNAKGNPAWGMDREKRRALKAGRFTKGLVMSMPLPRPGAWDAPTFRMCADKTEGDYRSMK